MFEGFKISLDVLTILSIQSLPALDIEEFRAVKMVVAPKVIVA